ncbi:MAG TPA: cytochrome c oxidase assembly protein [Gaiellales bacterium]
MRLRATSMVAGLLVLAVATVPPERIDATRPLAVHMAELVAVVYLAAPLLAWPAPFAAGRWTVAGLALAWATLTGAQVMIHAPALLHLELRHGLLHGITQACLLLLAVTCWSGVVAWPASRSPAGPVAVLLAAIPAGDALSFWLMGAGRPAYHGISMGDQRAAAALMFTGSVALGLAALGVGARAVRREHADQLLRERAEAGRA